MIEIKDSIDWKKWDDFVNCHPKGNIFQTSYMARVYGSTQNYEPISLAAVNLENDEILAVLQAAVIRQVGGFFSSFSARSVIYGGPLFVEKKEGLEAVEKLIEFYEKQVINKVIYTEIRNMWDTWELKNTLEQKGYRYEDHFNAIIDTKKPIEELWNQLKRDKKRGIKKAEDMGITIEICEKKSGVEIFYRLIRETYNNAKVPLTHISLFESTFNILVPDEKALLLFSRDQSGNIIATQLALMYKDTIYAWYTGACRESLKFHPGDSLIWYLIKYGNEHGYKFLDFGGGGGPNKNENLREYKSRFGTQFPCYGRYKKIYSKTKNQTAKIGLKIYRRLV